MSNLETARLYYEVMREEVVEHIRLRDQSLFLYLGASGVIMGIGLGAVSKLEVLLIIPFLALGASYILSQHDIHICGICRYLSKELNVFLNEDEEMFPQWDNSESLKFISPILAKYRYQGHLIILMLPVIVATGVNYMNMFCVYTVSGILWWLGFAAGIMVVFMTVRTMRFRRKNG